MILALDAMGGDHAPREVVLGALEATSHIRGEILLVGQPSQIQEFLPTPTPKNIRIHPASQVVEMDDKPMEAYRKKKDSSLAVAVELVKEGKADALISAGNTGAVTATAIMGWRQISGIHRPAIASFLPNKHGGFILLDAGASPDVDPEHMVEFAKMGRAYAMKVLHRKHGSVHLLNIGEEEGKGNAFAKEAQSLLSKFTWFEGNIEGKDMFRKHCDVVVCDAFVGNVVLKTIEGAAEFIIDQIREALPKNKLARLPYFPLRTLMRPLQKMGDYAEYGGSPLLGLNGLCIICHGRSNAKAIKNALFQAQLAVESGLVQTIRESFAANAQEAVNS